MRSEVRRAYIRMLEEEKFVWDCELRCMATETKQKGETFPRGSAFRCEKLIILVALSFSLPSRSRSQSASDYLKSRMRPRNRAEYFIQFTK